MFGGHLPLLLGGQGVGLGHIGGLGLVLEHWEGCNGHGGAVGLTVGGGLLLLFHVCGLGQRVLSMRLYGLLWLGALLLHGDVDSVLCVRSARPD